MKMRIAKQLAVSTCLLAAQAWYPALAQTLSHSTPRTLAMAGEPLLGFAFDKSGKHLYKVVGTGAHPSFGPVISLPDSISRIYLPPLQRYALIENADESLAIVRLQTNADAAQPNATALEGVIRHPDSVAFSPTGASALLYSHIEQRVQVITGMPGAPQVAREIAVDFENASAWAVSDDAGLVAAQFDGVPYFALAGSTLQPIATGIRPRAWCFLPRTHQLAVSDALQNEIVLLSDVTATPVLSRIVSTDTAADRLATTSDGDEIVAASSASGVVWEIPLAPGGRFEQVQQPAIPALTTLRDGHSFLFSAFPALTLLRATASELHAGH